MKQVYAVVNINFDYNDEYYYQSGNGTIEQLFVSKSQAETFMNNATVKELKLNHSIYMGEEHYELSEQLDKNISSMSDEEILKVIKDNEIQVFQIQTVNVTDDFIKGMRA